MKLKYIFMIVSIYTILAVLALTTPVSAHDQPAGNDFIMADWMLWSFLAFFGAGLIVFLVALKRGLFSNLEDAKYYVLSIDEPDLYTPEWAKDEDEELPDAIHMDPAEGRQIKEYPIR